MAGMLGSLPWSASLPLLERACGAKMLRQGPQLPHPHPSAALSHPTGALNGGASDRPARTATQGMRLHCPSLYPVKAGGPGSSVCVCVWVSHWLLLFLLPSGQRTQLSFCDCAQGFPWAPMPSSLECVGRGRGRQRRAQQWGQLAREALALPTMPMSQSKQ